MLRRELARRDAPGPAAAEPPAEQPAPGSVLDAYVLELPSSQNAIDLFDGEWSSQFPDEFDVQAGGALLFEDPRITWLAQVVGGLDGLRVLELGPLEGGHTYMLTRAGGTVTAIEANTKSYLKCLVAKEIADIEHARFLLGDFVEYLRNTKEHFDLCVASGVLYHMRDPVELLELIGGAADRLLLWTHYFDQERHDREPAYAAKFSEHTDEVRDGFAYRLHRWEYLTALEWKGFCGGSAPHAQWLSREDLFGTLEHLGWEIDAVDFDEPDHQNAPSIALIAHRRSEHD
jgi:hypothetical protein